MLEKSLIDKGLKKTVYKLVTLLRIIQDTPLLKKNNIEFQRFKRPNKTVTYFWRCVRPKIPRK